MNWYMSQPDPGQRGALKLISLEPAMRLVFMLPYTDLLLATKQQSVSVSIELSVEDNP